MRRATPTATASRTATPTETVVPVGALVAGHAAIMSAGLGSVQSLVAALVAQAAKSGTGIPGGKPQAAESNACSLNGTSQRACTAMGADGDKSIHLLAGR